MTLTSMLINYTLSHYFRGNKSAYANAVGMDVSNFRKARKAATMGNEHGDIITKSVEICVKANIPLGPVIDQFESQVKGLINLNPSCTYRYFIDRSKLKLAAVKKAIEGNTAIKPLYETAVTQLHEYETILCGDNETNTHQYPFFHEIGQVIDHDERTLRTYPCCILEESVDALYRVLQNRK